MCKSHIHPESRGLQMSTLQKCSQPGELGSTWSLGTAGTSYRYKPLLVHTIARLPSDKSRSKLSNSSLKPADEYYYMWAGYRFSAMRVNKTSGICKHCERKISCPICFPLTNISSITCLTLSLFDGIKNRSLQRSPHLFIDTQSLKLRTIKSLE